MSRIDQLLAAMRKARHHNVAVFADLASLVKDASFKARRPDDPDITMSLVEEAVKRFPAEALFLLQKIWSNDDAVLDLSAQLINELDTAPRKAVLLPGGGVLHTYAVREALALGLTPIVTDRDPNCPCAKIPGVEFFKIDCYDTKRHIDLAKAQKARLVGAYCAGADTHVQVAAAAAIIGSRWVSLVTAQTCKDKLLAKQALMSHGVPTAALVNPETSLRFICKPRRGSGSRGVKRHANSPGGYCAIDGIHEELLEGPEQSVEILNDGSGWRGINIVDRYFAWVGDQPLEWGHTNPSRLDEEKRNQLYKLAFTAAQAVGADIGFFKCDTIWTKDVPKVLECCPRLSGGWDSQLSTPFSSGRNLIRYGMMLACGMEPDESLLRSHDKLESVTVIHRPELATGPL
jgi:ATP-grasp domain